MIRATLADVARWTGGRGGGRRRVTGLSVDTRTIRRGDLFVALEAGRDGHDFLETAFRKGASGALVRRGHPAVERLAAAWRGRCLAVADTGEGLLALGRFLRGRLSARVIAVTGSCGKTTTKGILAHLLAGFGRTVASPKSFNNAIGVPLTIALADERTRYLVVEVGTNAPGEIAALGRIARPHVAVVTMAAEVHLEGLKTLAGVKREKYALWRCLVPGGTAVWNADQARSGDVRRRWKGRTVSFGLDRARRPDVLAEPVAYDDGGSLFQMGRHRVESSLPGLHNVANAAAALATVRALGLPFGKAVRRLATAPVPEGRLQLRRVRGIELLDDSYNANPSSVRAALDILGASTSAGGRRVAVLGDMLELGPRAASAHREIGRFLSRRGVDLFWGVGPAMREAVRAARRAGLPASGAKWMPDAGAAAVRIRRLLRPGDRVLVKGSRGMRMERVAEAILAG